MKAAYQKAFAEIALRADFGAGDGPDSLHELPKVSSGVLVSADDYWPGPTSMGP
jgi:hypothetical protein